MVCLEVRQGAFVRSLRHRENWNGWATEVPSHEGGRQTRWDVCSGRAIDCRLVRGLVEIAGRRRRIVERAHAQSSRGEKRNVRGGDVRPSRLAGGRGAASRDPWGRQRR